MRELRATVLRVRSETAEATTLELGLEGAEFPYRPGQHLLIDPHQFEELREDLARRAAERGKPEGPGYFSLSSDGLTPGVLEITVKVPRTPSASPLAEFLLRGLKPGRRLAIWGPGGAYGLPPEPPPGIEGFLHVCAGGGVAPNRGMIRHALQQGWPQRQLLVLQDRSPSDVLFASEWTALEERHGGRFRFRPFFSQSQGETLSAPRIQEAMRGFLESASSIAYLCGPKSPRGPEAGFVDRVRSILSGSLGFPEDRIVTP
jgi:ferredoxin-NADP reductase